jgi:hypothetical protein
MRGQSPLDRSAWRETARRRSIAERIADTFVTTLVMRTRTILVAMSLVAVVSASKNVHSAAVAPRRPTPHQRLDAALAPVLRALDELRASEAERRSVQDLLARAESLAAECVEQRQRGEHARAAAATRAMDMLARVVRGRIEALRAEAAADESERRASEGEALAVQARGALERATERRLLAAQRAERVSPRTPDAPGAAASGAGR